MRYFQSMHTFMVGILTTHHCILVLLLLPDQNLKCEYILNCYSPCTVTKTPDLEFKKA